MTPAQLLDGARSVLPVDWPARSVPEGLARDGFQVTAHEGPGDDQYVEYRLVDGHVEREHVGGPPSAVDVVYSHRPDDELPGIIEQARALGAVGIWCETATDRSRTAVEAAGLRYAGGARTTASA